MKSNISVTVYENSLLICMVIVYFTVLIVRCFMCKKYSILHDRGNFYLFIGSMITALLFLIVLIVPQDVMVRMPFLIDAGIILGFSMTGYGEKIHYVKQNVKSKYSLWKYKICWGISLFWGIVTVIELII